VSELQQNRYDQLLRRVGDLKGPGSKVNDVLHELFPVIDVERVPGELLLLGGTQLCVGATIVGALAANSSRCQVFNPVGSGKLATVTQVIFGTRTSTSLFRLSPVTIALTTGIGVESFLDVRLGRTARPACQIRTLQSVALTDATIQINSLNNTMYTLENENSVCVLPPGTGFECGNASNNRELIVTFFWRERVAQPSELNL